MDVPTSCALQLNSQDSADAAVKRITEGILKDGMLGGESWQYQLSLKVIYEYLRGPSSPWHPYVSTFPGVAPGVPYPRQAWQFTPQELSSAHYASLEDNAKLQQLSLQIFWGEAEDPLVDALGLAPATCDLRMMEWALSVVMSRTMYLHGTSQLALVPVLDMVNHEEDPNCEVKALPGHGSVSLWTKREVFPDEPLVISYGLFSNDQLMMNYGFVTPHNPHDRYWLPWTTAQKMLLGEQSSLSHIHRRSTSPRVKRRKKSPLVLTATQQHKLAEMGLLQAGESSSAGGTSFAYNNNQAGLIEGMEVGSTTLGGASSAEELHEASSAAMAPATVVSTTSSNVFLGCSPQLPAGSAQLQVDSRLLEGIRVLLDEGGGEIVSPEDWSQEDCGSGVVGGGPPSPGVVEAVVGLCLALEEEISSLTSQHVQEPTVLTELRQAHLHLISEVRRQWEDLMAQQQGDQGL